LPLPFTDMFWEQMAWIQPESYLSDGRDFATLATRNLAFYKRVERYFADEGYIAL
jgi:hypothetical protein